ncbi:dihydroxyacetone kinase phosphoryl donor subunit DhaM [Humibacter soli]
MNAGAEGRLVSLVVVSHSDLIARGVVEVVQQMSPDVVIEAAGGTTLGGVGTDVERVMEAIRTAGRGAGVVVLTDLGSAVLSAETALELLGGDWAASVRISDGPLVEGAVTAGVRAQTGGSLDEVAEASRARVSAPSDSAPSGAPAASTVAPDGYLRTATLVNPDGLHARPAAEFVKLATSLGVKITVNGKDARSLLGILSLGLVQGATVEIATDDPNGDAAVDRLIELVESGFTGPR